jgi:hypothetical protein
MPNRHGRRRTTNPHVASVHEPICKTPSRNQVNGRQRAPRDIETNIAKHDVLVERKRHLGRMPTADEAVSFSRTQQAPQFSL